MTSRVLLLRHGDTAVVTQRTSIYAFSRRQSPRIADGLMGSLAIPNHGSVSGGHAMSWPDDDAATIHQGMSTKNGPRAQRAQNSCQRGTVSAFVARTSKPAPAFDVRCLSTYYLCMTVIARR